MWHPVSCESTNCQRSRYFRVATILLALLSLSATVIAGSSPELKVGNGFITTRDGVNIHYLIAGTPHLQWHVKVSGRPMGEAQVAPTAGPTLLFVPGWTMPAWIWQKQIDFFSKNYRVVAMDPRSQGESSETGEGLYPAVRARDIKAVVDNFGGLAPGEGNPDLLFIGQILDDRQKNTEAFVRHLCFKKPHPADYINRVIAACMRTPTSDAVALLVGKDAADYRATAAKIDKPALFCYADSPYMSAEAQATIQQSVKGSRLEVFRGDGHALFMDDPEHFNTVLESFLNALPK